MTSFISAVVLYAISMSITPGPTNIIMLSTGVNLGFRNTIPFALGAVLGFSSISAVVVFGLSGILNDNSIFMDVLAWVGSAFIIYMGYKIATSKDEIEAGEYEKPGFFYGAMVQILSPKSWIAAVAGAGAFSLAKEGSPFILYITTYNIVGFLCVLTWGYAGAKISHFLHNERNLTMFNYMMGGSLILVAVYLLLMQNGLA